MLRPSRKFSQLHRRLCLGFGGNLVWVLFNQGSTFALNIVAANLLGIEGFGRYAIVLVTVQAASSIASLGMGYTATKYLAEFRATNKQRAGELFGFCLVGAAIGGTLAGMLIYGLADRLSVSLSQGQDLAHLLRICAVAVVANSINFCLAGILAGFEAFRVLGRVGVVSGVAYLGIGASFIFLWGISGGIVGLAVSALVQVAILCVAVIQEARANAVNAVFGAIAREWRLIKHWVIPGLLSGTTAIPALWFAQAILARQPGGYADLAIYASAFNLMTIVLFLPSIANSVTMSVINSALGERDEMRYKNVFWANTMVSLLLVLTGACGLAFGAEYFLTLFGRSFIVGRSTLMILLAATIPEVLTIALTQVLQSKGKAWLAVLTVNVPRDAAIVILALVLAPSYGAMGLALAYLVGRTIGLIMVAVDVAAVGIRLNAELADFQSGRRNIDADSDKLPV